MIEELVNDYAGYLKVDLIKELMPLEETIEDMLTRLEEFESLMTMVATDGAQCLEGPIPQILARREELDSLCGKVDRLQVLVQRVKREVAEMQDRVDMAEADLAPVDHSFRNMFRPFFKKADPLSPRTPKTYEAPEIFSAAAFFPSHDAPDEGASNTNS